MKQKRVLLRGLPKDFDVTLESVMSLEHTFIEAVLKLILREARLRDAEDALPQTLVTTAK